MTGSLTEILILAGGYGTRLRSVVSDVPKPMAPVKGKPFIQYLMDYWVFHGARRFVLSIGYMGEKIKEYFGDSYRNCSIEYVFEPEPLGTGGAVRKALTEIQWQSPYVMLINGDTWFEVQSDHLLHAAQAQNLPISIALKPIEKNDRYGAVSLDESSRIDAFDIGEIKHCLINGGCYALLVSEVLAGLAPYPEKFSFERDYLVEMAKERLIASSIQDVPFLDIGIPEDYLQFIEREQDSYVGSRFAEEKS